MWSFRAYMLASLLGFAWRAFKMKRFGSFEIMTSIAMVLICSWTPSFRDWAPWETWLREAFSYRLFEIPKTWWSMILLVVLTDYIMYWEHYISHKIRVFWALHSVHHSSPEFNLGTTALRNPPFLRWFDAVPMAVLCYAGWGFAEVMMSRMLVGTYSIWVHSDLKISFGWLRFVFVTPNFHRLHHATNHDFLDCNFGFLFSFWDRIHGTARVWQNEELEYGLVGRRPTLNPFVLFFREWWFMCRDVVVLKKLSFFLRFPSKSIPPQNPMPVSSAIAEKS